MIADWMIIKTYVCGIHKHIVFFKRSNLSTPLVFPQEAIMSADSYFCVFLLLSTLIARAGCSSGKIVKLQSLDYV